MIVTHVTKLLVLVFLIGKKYQKKIFKLLKSWEGQRALNVNGVRLVVFEDVSNKVTEYIKDVKEFIKKEKERCAKLLEEEQKRRAQAKAKRDLAKAKKEAAAIEKAKKLLREAGEI